MFDTLYGKTFVILGTQLGITWLSTVLLLGWVRNHYYARSAWVGGGINNDGQLDLDLDWETIKPFFWTLLIVNVLAFLALLFYGEKNLRVGIPLFCFWSILTGFELALCLISVDENLGEQVLALTALVTVGAGIYGINSFLDLLSK